MKKLTTAAMTVALLAGGIALPVAASAAAHPSAKHHPHAVKHKPCAGKGIGIDLAIGSTNVCIPL